MKRTILNFVIVTCCIMTPVAALSSGDAAAGESKIMMCAGCHGGDGNSVVPSFPKLAGQGEKYLTKQLKDVKYGRRKIASMTGILDSFSEQDWKELYKLSEETFVDESDSSKAKAAGAGLTDND